MSMAEITEICERLAKTDRFYLECPDLVSIEITRMDTIITTDDTSDIKRLVDLCRENGTRILWNTLPL